uniref:Nodulin MtN21 family protein, putative n=1 Tax=Oryza sativa subsp. japonica TaxID=39947 RepID=Q2RAV4_ORYSJ|nr:nodulin MtN21 family protein, putative [Oryza sativa Japonica Group]
MVKASMKPYFVAIVVQLIYTGMFVISKAAFNHGMNIYIFVFYRQAVGSLILLPTFLLERHISIQQPIIFMTFSDLMHDSPFFHTILAT